LHQKRYLQILTERLGGASGGLGLKERSLEPLHIASCLFAQLLEFFGRGVALGKHRVGLRGVARVEVALKVGKRNARGVQPAQKRTQLVLEETLGAVRHPLVVELLAHVGVVQIHDHAAECSNALLHPLEIDVLVLELVEERIDRRGADQVVDAVPERLPGVEGRRWW